MMFFLNDKGTFQVPWTGHLPAFDDPMGHRSDLDRKYVFTIS